MKQPEGAIASTSDAEAMAGEAARHVKALCWFPGDVMVRARALAFLAKFDRWERGEPEDAAKEKCA